MRYSTQDVLDLLPIVQGQGWHLTHNGMIRNRRGDCPLVALARKVGPVPMSCHIMVSVAWEAASGRWKLPPGAFAIISASDSATLLRPALMQALGMEAP